MNQTKIPFYLLTGFLGSGKTTFLEKFLNYYAPNKKVAVIQNEFANVSVDAQILSNNSKWSFELVEMNSGSVFCVCLFSGFQEALNQLIESKKPDVIILEATGLADPIAITQLLTPQLYLAKVFTIIDAVNFIKCKNIRCIQSQIQIADTLVVNKCDLVNNSQQQQIIAMLSIINPFAKIEFTQFCQLSDSVFIENLTTVVQQQQLEGKLSQCAPTYYTQVYKSAKAIKESTFTYFINQLNENTLRLKGTVLLEGNKSILLQTVMGCTQLYDLNETCVTQLIHIGLSNLNFNDLHIIPFEIK